jgi:hypothetical protein
VQESGNQDNLRYADNRLHNYSRSFVVGDGINREGISASLETVPDPHAAKSERVKPRK